MSQVRYPESPVDVVEALAVAVPRKPDWRTRVACRLWGHHVDNRSFREKTGSQRSCRCGERYLRTDGSHARVRCLSPDHSYRPPGADVVVCPGNVNATSEVFAPPPVANTMYCLPLCMKVIGGALVLLGIGTAPTCLPVALSTA